MKVSIIIPIFNEADNLPLLNKRLYEVLEKEQIDCEVIYVNDGSIDLSLSELKKLWESSYGLKVITLAKNYGQTLAISAGVDNSGGDYIITMDGDLQNDPADIPAILTKLKEGYDVVSGWRIKRKDHLLQKKLPSIIVNMIIAIITKVKLHDLGCTLKGYKRAILEDIEFYGEIHRFLPLYAAMYGARIAEIPVKHHRRKHGKSKYGLLRFIRGLLDFLTIMFMWKFMTKPIYVFGGIGIVSVGVSTIIGLFIIIRRVLWGGAWVSPLLFLFVIFCTMGIQFILIGILAEFIMRLYYGMRAQRRYRIKKILDKKPR